MGTTFTGGRGVPRPRRDSAPLFSTAPHARTATRESDFQRALLLALSARPDVRLWRQNVGTLPVRDSRGRVVRVFRAGPPKGASDLSGIVRPEGWRIEIEVKGPSGRVTPDQVRWGVFVRGAGGVHLVATYDDRLPLAENVRRAVAALDAALRARRGLA